MKATVISHREMLQRKGRTIASPVSGSMLPLVRPHRDYAVFEPAGSRLKKYDVVLYYRGRQAVMHRIVGVKKPQAGTDGGACSSDIYIIRGDNGCANEYIPREQICGRMTMLYRDEHCIDCAGVWFGLVSRIIVGLHPLIRLYRRLYRCLYRRLYRVRRLRRLVRRMKGKQPDPAPHAPGASEVIGTSATRSTSDMYGTSDASAAPEAAGGREDR